MNDAGGHNSRLKICLYTTTALPAGGGQELVVDALARQLMQLGQEPIVLAPGLKHRRYDRGLPYRVVRHPRFVSTRRFVNWYRHFLLRLHRRERFDVLHCHEAYPAGWLGALCRPRMRGVPLVITMHDGGIASGRPAKAGIEARRAAALASADALIAISNLVRQAYERMAPGHRRVEMIPNGVDAELLAQPLTRPVDLDLPFEPFSYALFLGRLTEPKGADLVITSLASMERAPAIGLVIAGAGPQESALRQMAIELGIAQRVHFAGWVADEHKRYLLRHALFTIVPSRRPEAFGLVILESGGAGRPVIAADIAALHEAVEHGRTGLLFEAGSSAALAQAMDALHSDHALADAMGAAAARRAQSYNWPDIARRHLALYRDLLHSHRGTHR